MDRPKGGLAVMADHAPQTINSDDQQRARWRELDFYGTPPFASRAGAELIREIDPSARSAWEPACGDGIMAACIVPYFNLVLATDIEPQGYGDRCDFLDPRAAREEVDWIITNPPFKHAAEFVRLGMERARCGVAVLCRLAFLETVDRYALHFQGQPGLAVLAPFCERVPMQLGPWAPDCSTATAYAWFVYRHGHQGEPLIRAIPPGTRKRLSLPEDVRRFVRTASSPLFTHGETSRITA